MRFFNDIPADWLRDALAHLVVDVDNEVWRWWVPVILVSKYLVSVDDFGDVAVVVFSPYLLFKVENVDIVVAKRH